MSPMEYLNALINAGLGDIPQDRLTKLQIASALAGQTVEPTNEQKAHSRQIAETFNANIRTGHVVRRYEFSGDDRMYRRKGSVK